MKKLFFFLLATILVVCNGCDPINPLDPPVVVKDSFMIKGIAGPNGKVSPSQQKVEIGKWFTFHIESDPGYIIDYIKDDGNIFPAPLMDFYTVSNVSKDDSFEVAFKKDSVMFPLLRIKWIQNGDFSFIEGMWIEWNLLLPITFSFNQDGTYSETWNGTIINGTWSLNRNVSPMTLNCSGMHPFTVETLNEKVFSIYYTGIDGAIYKYIFEVEGYK